MALTKQQIAIICYYQGRRKPQKPARDKLVLNGSVKMTPRRREILHHVAFTDSIWWKLERDWSNRWASGRAFQPYLGPTNVMSIVKYLRKNRLVRLVSDEGMPIVSPSHLRASRTPVLIITPKGMDALLECVKP